jgi:molybdopterin-biosynthesis enzyme MoeA-like protein
MRFVAVIIGSELLDGRREDGHFEFLRRELARRHWSLSASLMIGDEPDLIESVFRLAREDRQMVLFSFGGIGATPDDYTRHCAANVFTGGRLAVHPEGEERIRARFGQPSAYQLEMVRFPKGAGLLNNPVNGVPGFYLDDRLFFVPGFPSMAHPMIIEALDHFYPAGVQQYARSLIADCGEGRMMHLMDALPESIALSCLPEASGQKRETTLTLKAADEALLGEWFDFFRRGLDEAAIAYRIEEAACGV